jgi:predicted permease
MTATPPSDDRLNEEIRFHLESQIAKHRRAGKSADEARRLALIEFGGVEPTKERVRDQRRGAWIAGFGRDLRYGARALARSRAFTVATVLTLGLGLGSATTLFSIVEGVLLKSLPYPDPDRIVRLYQLDGAGKRGNVSEPNFEDWRTGTHSFAAMAEMQVWGPTPVLGEFEPAMAQVAAVSAPFFDVLGVGPAQGRRFVPEELREDGVPAALVSDRYFGRTFGAQTPFGGQTLRMGARTIRVVGVMPPEFDYPVGTEIWLPRELSPLERSPERRTAHNFQAIARLADGVSLDRARQEIGALSRDLKARYGDQTWMSDATAVPLLDQITAAARPTLQVLFGAALLLLLIACVNVSNLLLARGSTRRRELAVQLALGAERWRIVRQTVAETLVLCAAGAATGVVFARLAVRALVDLQPATVPRLQNVGVDVAALGFSTGVALLTALVLGLVTSWHGRGTDVRDALADGLRTATDGRARRRVRETLVVLQVAVTLVLLAGTALLARSFVRLLAVDPGYRTDDALVVDLTISRSTPADRLRQIATQRELLARLSQLPGVAGVGLTSGFPLGGGNYTNGQFLVMTGPDELRTPDDIAKLGSQVKERAGLAGLRIVSESYFRTMGIPLLRGRSFSPSDASDAPHVAVISQSLAEQKWSGQDPLDRYVQFGNMDGDLRPFRIVGVVGDVRELPLESAPSPIFYAYYQQRPAPASRFSLVLRGPRTDALTATASRVVREVDPQLPIRTRTMADAFDRAVSGRRFNLLLIGAFGVAALVLATLGTYGVIAYLVTQRTREIGIRHALGAQPSQLRNLILGRGALLGLVGASIGLAAALALTRLVDGMLFGIPPNDPAAFAVGIAVLAGAVLLASYVLARRAMRIDAATMLRGE